MSRNIFSIFRISCFHFSILLLSELLSFAGPDPLLSEPHPTSVTSEREIRDLDRREKARKNLGIPPRPRPRASICGLFCGHLQLMEELGVIHFMDFMAQTYGSDGTPVQVSLGPKTLTIISDPDDIQKILLSEDFVKGYGAKKLSEYFLRNGVGVLEASDYWKEINHFMRPYFSTGGIKNYLEMMTENSKTFIDNLLEQSKESESKPLDFEKLYTAFAIRTISESMFNMKIPHNLEGNRRISEISGTIREVLDFVQARIKFPLALPLFIPTSSNLAYLSALEKVRKIGSEIIENDRLLEEKGEGSGTLIRALRIAEKAGSLGKISPLLAFSGNDLLDQILSIFFAGHDTTSHLLTMATYQLSLHPEMRTRIETELRDRLGDSYEVTTTDQLSKPNLPYLQAFLDETLRLDSPVPGVGRDAVKEVNLAGYSFPKGSTFFLSFNALHRLEEFWPEPEKFRPERFITTAESTLKRHPKAFSPFGGGERLCLGQHFAYQEAKVMLIELLKRNIRFHLAKDAEIERVFAVTIKLKGGLPLVID